MRGVLRGHDPGGRTGLSVWHDPQVDHAYDEETAGQLQGLLIRRDDRLRGKDITLVAEFVDVDELGLALEQIADVFIEDEHPLASDERADILERAARMQMSDLGREPFSSVPKGVGPAALSAAT